MLLLLLLMLVLVLVLMLGNGIPGRRGPVRPTTVELSLVGDAIGGEDVLEDVGVVGQRLDHLAMLVQSEIGGGDLVGVGFS